MFSKWNDSSEPTHLGSSDPSLDQVDLLVYQMAAAWREGVGPSAAEILAEHPELNDESAIRLIFEEVSLRREAGLSVNTVEILARYSKWRDDLEPLLGFDKLLNQSTVAQAFEFPKIGDRLGDFQLIDELGRGASGRTFLAAQPSLADRPVVLKLMARDQSEHLSLARLQHTYIVPLYWEQEFPEFGLRGLLMPYLGGANLAAVLDELAGIPFSERKGSDLNAALGRLIDPYRQRPMKDEPRFQQFLGEATYDDAACWIAVCLAEGLQYAHERGLIHMDVKPSNVLITADGQPMLLDFHLARSPIPAWSAIHDRIGGTPGWTSPEQQAAMHAVLEGKPIETGVDGRSDVYALGLLLYEMLGGRWDRSSRDHIPRLRACNPAISTGLSDIIHKSLANDPAQRYHSAATFADDLRRHLQDLPLKGVSNRSLTENWAKWRRRSPDSSSQLLLVAAAFTIVMIGAVFVNERVKSIQAWADESALLWEKKDFENSLDASEKGLELSRDTPFFHPYLSRLKELQSKANWLRSVAELNSIANQIRLADGSVWDQTYKIQGLGQKLKRAWESHRSLEKAPSDSDKTINMLRDRMVKDYREIAVAWARIRAKIEPRDSASIEAREILAEATRTFGTSRILIEELQKIDDPSKVRLPYSLDEATPSTAWEYYELGRLFLEAKRFDKAEANFTKSLELDPRAFWTNFFEGNCAFRQGKYEEALAAFRACVTIDPESATVRVNRGLTYEALGRLDEAHQEYTEVIRLAPNLVEGYLNRGHVSYQQGRHKEAIVDLKRALKEVSNSDEILQARIKELLTRALRSLDDA